MGGVHCRLSSSMNIFVLHSLSQCSRRFDASRSRARFARRLQATDRCACLDATFSGSLMSQPTYVYAEARHAVVSCPLRRDFASGSHQISPVFRPIDRDFIRPRQVAHLLTGSDCSPMNRHNHSTLSALRGQIVLMSRDLYLVVNENHPVPWIVFDEPSCEQTRLQ